MKRILLALVLGLGFGGLSACATAPPAGPKAMVATGDLIDRYDAEAIHSILSEMQMTVADESVNSAGKPFMMVDMPGGASLRIMGESCEGKGKDQVCAGIQLSTQFAPTGDVDFDKAMATANRTLRPAKLFWAGDTLAYERYLIMDGGVSRANLMENISVYVEILQGLMSQLFKDADN